MKNYYTCARAQGKKMKNSLKVIAVAIMSIALFATAGYAAMLEGPGSIQSAMPTAPPTDIPGWIFTGRYIKIGINRMGTLGVGKAADPGGGFQFPIGDAYESSEV